MSQTEQILSQLPGDVLTGLRRADRLWQTIKENTAPIPVVVKHSQQPLGTVDWDIVICGGTLGIFIGAALQMQGWRVALIERGILRGREQEWNISRKELDVFVEMNLLSDRELEKAIATTYNPARVSFFNGPEIWVRDVLNIGVDPVYLLDILKSKFIEAGGKIFENTAFEGAIAHSDGVVVEGRREKGEGKSEKAEGKSEKAEDLEKGEGKSEKGEGKSENREDLEEGERKSEKGEGKSENREDLEEASINFKTRLLIDAMGHFSPIVRQARQGQKPDGICLVVGTCAKGFPQNETGDLLVSFTPIQHQCQYFWESFPARDGRTTYLFTYLDAHPKRFSLEFLFEEYLRLLPQYQGVEVDKLQFQRALFGFFPSYRQSPLQMPWHRIVAVGDSSGSQSPVSFGGFGSMLRHLQRLTAGISEALQNDALNSSDLALLQPYQPNLSVTWLFQRAMTAGVEQNVDPQQINQLLSGVFRVMQEKGDRALKPFLQDVVQFAALSQTLATTGLKYPGLIAKVIPQVGLIALLDWMRHYVNLGVYSSLSSLGQAMPRAIATLPSVQQYYLHRWIEAWKYGSGGDYSP